MTKEEIKSIYLNAEKVVSLLESPKGKEIRDKNPNLHSIAHNALKTYKAKYYEIKISESVFAKDLLKSSDDAIEALKIIPETSHLAVTTLNNLITENSEKLQNELLFNSETFYEKYFFTLPTVLTDEVNKDVLENPSFKEWFGNSQVVDKEGSPLIVYHGTGGDVDEFSNFKFNIFPAAYFAENKSYSDWFAKIKNGNQLMYKCFLKVQNPIDLTSFEVRKVTYQDFTTYLKLKYGYDMPENKMLRAMSDAQNGVWVWQYLRAGADWLKFIQKSREFDGFHYYENNPQDIVNGKENVTLAWLVLNGNQIKSADMRNTTYSLFTDDIRMKKGGEL